MRRAGLREVLVVVTVATWLAPPAAAQPRGLSARAEVAVGGMLAGLQRSALGYGSVLSAGVRAGYAPWDPIVLSLGYCAWYGPSEAGDGWQHTVEAGVRLELPLGSRLRPWIDAELGYARTGALGRLAASSALGLELDVAKLLSLGPYVRYGRTFATEADAPSDAQMLVGGITLTARVPREHGPPARPPIVRDSDGDGVRDEDDACQRSHAGESPDPERPGCPVDDEDGDGTADRDDLCPTVAAGAHPELSRPGCPAPDSDGDGLLDREDACPTIPVGAHPDPFRLGCPDGDDDGDGMLNGIDRCRARAAGPMPDPVTPGCPLPDRDADSVPDATDHCPAEAGAPTSTRERNGCPGLVRIEAGELRLARPVLFAPGTDRLLPPSVALLAAIADALRATPWIARLSIEGYGDEVGDEVRNRDLAERRAGSVMTWLVSHGVRAARLEAHGHGESRSLGHEQALAESQRIELRIVDPAQHAPARGDGAH